jgi:hypothetical protein
VSNREFISSINHIGSKIQKLITQFFTIFFRFINKNKRNAYALNEKSTLWDVYLKWHEHYLEKKDKQDFVGIEEQH